ncbi:MAG: PhoH family protein [Candidatus Omnitrophota bacterium]
MEKIIKVNSNAEAVALYGSLDENLRFAEKEFRVRISARNHRLKISGDKKNVDSANHFFQEKLQALRRGGPRPTPAEARRPEPVTKAEVGPKATAPGVQYFHRGKIIAGRSGNQNRYLQAIRDYDIVIGIGPAGTGKTYLAVAAAIDSLRKKHVARIILTRPAVEAGENLGFLPGDLYEKVNPYLRPLYDALHDMMDPDEAARCLERGVIEVAPLAYMRGRTLSGAFIILDEGQNCTHAQMKMFLTRLGVASKVVVTGDVTQIDLPGGKKSGLVEAQMVLANVKGVQFVPFDETDVVRHPLVIDIIRAYEKYDH